ncbi:hypothetical protein PUN28_012887 [Cardiocondyla obscurior]|uniref:Uncharacterized protein n=1 Tax=Cardiocondyla obscurior TaxID=286306 RepID=A0AAW2F9Q8_9HYME
MPLGKRKRVIIGRKRTAEQRNDATSALERAAAMEEEESRILNANHPISARSQQRADKLEEDFLDDNRNAPSRDLASTVLRDMAVVLRVSGVSKGLKGEYSKALREIACRTRANVTTMLTRLNTDVNTLRETIAQISPTQPPQSKKRREDPIPYKTTTGPISGTSKVVTSEVVSTKTTFKKPTNKAASEISTNAISSVHFKYLDELFHSWCTGKSSGEPRTRNQPRSSQATTGTDKESSKSKPVTASEHPRSATAIAGTSKESPGVETWATVAGRKTKNSNKTVGQGSRTTSGKKAPEQPKPKTTKRKTPNSAAVSITCENGQYQEILKMAKDRIDLKKLGIDSLRPKRGITGSIIYEIKGDNHNEKAKVLAKELSTALASVQQVRIACPQKTADIRIRDLDDYTRKDDVINAVLTSFETCRQEDLKLGEIRRSYNGLYTTVLKCPVAVANQLIEKKRIQIGWVSARIEALPARPLQCFRCLQKGHVRENCNSPIDRSNSCFRCGETNHTAVTCKNLPKCLICEELKKPFRHKMGGPACNAKTNRRQPRTQPASNTNRQDDGNPPQLSKEVMEVETQEVPEAPKLAPEITQDLLLHTLAECGGGIALISEPFNIPDKHPNWMSDPAGSVAIFWLGNDNACNPITSGTGWTAAKWRNIIVMATYLPPSINLEDMETSLEEISDFIKRTPATPILLGGDFNAKSPEWGCKFWDQKGRLLADWASGLGLLLVNRGDVNTCVAWRGESTVDITWANYSAVKHVCNWRVWEELETLENSDQKKWALRKLNMDLLMTALESATWPEDIPADEPEDEAKKLTRILTDACNMAMPLCSNTRVKGAYWWNESIASLRKQAVIKQRAFTRCRRRRRSTQEEVDQAYEDYREARRNLRIAITAAKTAAWAELMETIDSDPWGRPYKIISGQYRRRGPPATEMLESQQITEIVTTLFPRDTSQAVIPTPLEDIDSGEEEEQEDPTVTEEEITRAIKGIKANKAPGPDNVPGKIITLAADILLPRLCRVFTRLLREGVFPREWKRASLVLIPKPGKPLDNASSFRPICLIDELGKLMERIINCRLTEWVESTGRGLSVNQFGFRKGHSTIDAIQAVKKYVHKSNEKGETRGVPQGSVLGPTLWILTYDAVLQAPIPSGCNTICYADDTLVLSTGLSWREAVVKSELAVHIVVETIKSLASTQSAGISRNTTLRTKTGG